MNSLYIILILLFIPLTAHADIYESTDEALTELSSLAGEFDFYSFSKNIMETGKLPSPNSLLSYGADIFVKEIRESANGLAVLLIPVFLFGILKFIRTERGEDGVSSVAFTGCFAFMVAIITAVMKNITALATDTAVTVDAVTKSLVPVLFTLLTAMGNITQATLTQPLVLTVSQIMSELLKSYLIPLVLTGFALTVTESVTGMKGLKYFGDMIIKITKWLLVFLVVFFLSLLSAQSISGAALDGIALKSTKFAVSNFIPVVGGAIADGVGTLALSMKLIKNAAGLSGVFGVIFICFVPLIKIYAVSLLFHIMAALSYPVSDTRFGDILDSAGSAVSITGGILLVMVFVFIVTAAVIIGSNPALV